MVKVDFEGIEAAVDAGKWTCEESQAFERLLNTQAQLPVSGYHPDPDLQLAEQAIEFLGGGTIIHHDEPVDEDVPGRVY